MVRYFWGVVCMLLLCSPAHASLSAFLTNTGNGVTWDYTLRFVPSVPGETLNAGNFVTIYDYAPDVQSAAATGWLGIICPSMGPVPQSLAQSVGIVDDSDAPNVVFTWTGATIATPQDFAAFITTAGAYPMSMLSDGAGSSNNGAYAAVFPISVPMSRAAVPEPASLLLLSVVIFFRRRESCRLVKSSG